MRAINWKLLGGIGAGTALATLVAIKAFGGSLALAGSLAVVAGVLVVPGILIAAVFAWDRNRH